MVSQGARSIVLVSRTGNMAGKVKTLIDELPEANIVVKSCDVANSSSVEKFITEGMVGMPTVGGVIHGAMVLNVSSPRPFWFMRRLTNDIRTYFSRK